MKEKPIRTENFWQYNKLIDYCNENFNDSKYYWTCIHQPEHNKIVIKTLLDLVISYSWNEEKAYLEFSPNEELEKIVDETKDEKLIDKFTFKNRLQRNNSNRILSVEGIIKFLEAYKNMITILHSLEG